MAAIKKFFEKRKLDVKFKKAGGGHKLTEDTRSVPSASAQKKPIGAVSKPTEEKMRAAEAALARMSQPRPGTGKGGNMSALRSQISQEMAAEKQAAEKARALADVYSAPKETQLEGAPVLAVNGVFYKCPLVGDVVLPKKEMEDHINVFLLSQLAEEPMMTSALMIYTLNKDAEKVKVCVDTICKYLDNIIAHPAEEKYCKIRINNKAFQERLLPLSGTQEFLQAIGFEMKSLPGPNETPEDFYVLNAEKSSNTDHIVGAKDVLLAAEPIRPELDRNLRIYYPTSNAGRMQVPPEFYSISADELKKEQQLRQEAVETLGMLRTKEMRERERQRELRRYRYTLIRVRFPDGIILQGTFRAHEKIKAVFDFVRDAIELDWVPFTFAVQGGLKITEENLTLAEMDLSPAALINFQFDSTVLSEITAQQGTSKLDRYLQEDLIQRIEYL